MFPIIFQEFSYLLYSRNEVISIREWIFQHEAMQLYRRIVYISQILGRKSQSLIQGFHTKNQKIPRNFSHFASSTKTREKLILAFTGLRKNNSK
jgi:hypothetical protein